MVTLKGQDGEKKIRLEQGGDNGLQQRTAPDEEGLDIMVKTKKLGGMEEVWDGKMF